MDFLLQMSGQGMENISLSEVIRPQDGFWDFILYVIIFLKLVLLAFLFNGSLRDVILIASSMLAAVADKIYLFGFVDGGCTTINCAVEFHTKESFFTYVARVMIFAFPLIITTQTKIKRAKPLCVLIGIGGLVYTFGRWFVQQYPEGKSDFRQPGTMIEDGLYMANTISLSLILLEAWVAKRRQKHSAD